MTDSGHYGICQLCGERIAVEVLIAHLRVDHHIDAEVSTWPDGAPVVIDESLLPSDFKSQDVIDNIRAWRAGKEKLDVMALFDELARRYGPGSPTNYLAFLLDELADRK